jgi:Kef-type K+ transport system membrane component KefB
MSSLFPIKDPVLIFAMVAALILLSPIILGRYRLPGMIGLLLAGAALGPNALGVLARDQSFVLFGTVGLLYIMFMAALEIDLAVFKRYRVHSVVFGLLSFLVPQCLGVLVTRYLLGFEWPAAILLASLFGSHTLLANPIASRLGISKTQAVTTAVGGTIVTDSLALLVLAVIAGSTTGAIDETFWYRLGISILVYVAAILIGLPRLARWFFRNVARDGVAEFVFVLAVVFGCASLSRTAGVEPIVGAFLAGLALNRLIPHNGTLMNRIQFTGEAVFVPFFLLSVGMLLDVRVFLGGFRSWAVAGGMVATVVLTKFLAAESTRVLLRYGKNDARVIFGLTVAQAAGTLAATMVGYRLGLFDDAVVNGAILMILVTCVLAPVVVDRYGRPIAVAQEADVGNDVLPPQRVLVALSNPAAWRHLLDLSVLLRDKAQAQPIFPLTVVQEGPRAVEDVGRAEKLLSKAVLHLSAADIAANAITRIDLNVASGILRAQRELRGTEVVVGWSQRGSAAEFFFGSDLEKLLEDPHYTLVVSRLTDPLNTCQRVLLCVPPNADHEHCFQSGIRLIKRLARQLGTPLLVFAERKQEQRLKECIRSIKPTADTSYRTLESWGSLSQAVADHLGESDLLILYGCRRGSLAWRPAMNPLPTRLARNFPRTNLLVVYPSEPREEPAALEEPTREGLVDRVRPDRVLVGLEATTLQEAVARMLACLPGDEDSPKPPELTRYLVEQAQDLTSGVALIHGETEHVAGHSVVLAISDRGVLLPGTHTKAHVMVMILDPPGRDPMRHLETLAAVARVFQSSDVVARARSAVNAEQVLALLAEKGGSIRPRTAA